MLEHQSWHFQNGRPNTGGEKILFWFHRFCDTTIIVVQVTNPSKYIFINCLALINNKITRYSKLDILYKKNKMSILCINEFIYHLIKFLGET